MTLLNPHHFPKMLTERARQQVPAKPHHAAVLQWEVYWVGNRGGLWEREERRRETGRENVATIEELSSASLIRSQS